MTYFNTRWQQSSKCPALWGRHTMFFKKGGVGGEKKKKGVFFCSAKCQNSLIRNGSNAGWSMHATWACHWPVAVQLLRSTISGPKCTALMLLVLYSHHFCFVQTLETQINWGKFLGKGNDVKWVWCLTGDKKRNLMVLPSCAWTCGQVIMVSHPKSVIFFSSEPEFIDLFR